MTVLSVNALKDDRNKWNTKFISIEGCLGFESGRYCIYNWPKPEQINDAQSLPNIEFEAAVIFKLEEAVLNKWIGKRVVISGYTPLGTGVYRYDYPSGCEPFYGLTVTRVYLYDESGDD